MNRKFSFKYVSEATVRKAVKNFFSEKGTAGEIPINVLKCQDFCFSELTRCINQARCFQTL